MAKLYVQGRLGNTLIQFISSYLFCCKHKLNLDFGELNVPHHCNCLSLFLNNEMLELVSKNENKQAKTKLVIDDDNFFNYYHKNNIEEEISFIGYFYFFDLLEIHREKIKKLFKIEYDNNIDHRDLFIHYRLGDMNNSYFTLPLEYFTESIEKTNFRYGYISSDSINDEKCQFLIKKYNLIPVNLLPYETLMFGKNFNNLILSESTFSFLIGYFSRAKNVIHNKNHSKWGNIPLFSFDSFNF